MRPGTEAIIGHLKRAKKLKFTRQQWADLVDDVAALGKEEFLKAAADERVTTRSLRKPKSQEGAGDALAATMERYRKKSGLKAAEFIAALHRKLEHRVKQTPAKSAMKSTPRYLSFVRQSLGPEEIEAGFAAVLSDYA